MFKLTQATLKPKVNKLVKDCKNKVLNLQLREPGN